MTFKAPFKGFTIYAVFFLIARRESFKGLASSFKALIILILKGDSIAVEMSSLSRVKRALRAFRRVRKLGNYTGWGITRVGDLRLTE
jgi:hypothetical protein